MTLDNMTLNDISTELKLPVKISNDSFLDILREIDVQ